MMRSSDYARTPPEAPETLPVFVVRLLVAIMAGTYAQELRRRQRLFMRKTLSARLNSTSLLRDKLAHEPS
jgi:hypothetical protein